LTASPSLRSAYERHLNTSRGLASATVRNYASDLTPFLEYLQAYQLAPDDDASVLRRFIERGGPRHVAQEYRSLVRAYVSWLLESRELHAGRRTGQQGHQRSSVVRCLAALRSFFRYLIAQGLIPDAPIWAPRSTLMRQYTPKASRRLPDTLSVGEAALLVEAPSRALLVENPAPKASALAARDRALLELLYAAGLRVSETAGLAIDDLTPKGYSVRVWGKGSKARQVPVGRAAAEALKQYLSTGRPVLATQTSGEALFLGRQGGRLSVRAIQALVHRYAHAVGLRDGVHPHTLRHSYATHLLDGGADLRIVQELLGHSTPSATQVYTHISQAEAKRVYLSALPLARGIPEEGESAAAL
jgi:site-specific recombinase XerD